MNNGKIYKWFVKNRYWLFCAFVSCCVGIVLLHSCQNRLELLVKNNKFIVTKTK